MTADKPMHPDLRKRHRRTVTLSTVVSTLAICGVVLPVVGAITSPWVVTYLGTAMADTIADEVRKQTAPTNAGLKVIIESSIAELEDDIGRLEYRRDYVPEGWTPADSQELTNKRRRLAAQRRALAAMLAAEGNGE